MDSLEILENSYTKLYKKVYELNIPADYIFYENIDGVEYYKNLQEIIIDNYDTSIIDLYNKYGRKMKFSNFIYSYFYYTIIEDSSNKELVVKN
jgi:triacylglycerol esterase/lipase EstA (alpha/beta hydrolase family)